MSVPVQPFSAEELPETIGSARKKSLKLAVAIIAARTCITLATVPLDDVLVHDIEEITAPKSNSIIFMSCFYNFAYLLETSMHDSSAVVYS